MTTEPEAPGPTAPAPTNLAADDRARPSAPAAASLARSFATPHWSAWLAQAGVRSSAIRAAVAPGETSASLVGSSDRSPVDLSARLRGEECSTCWGPHWRIEHPLDELAPAWRGEWQRVAPLLPALGSDEEVHPEQRDFAGAFPQRTMYLDLETCGFAGSIVFLVGLVHHSPQGLVLTQLLARNYAEEKAMLESLWQIAAGHEVLVTFNGKSFDWPVVHDRSTLHHLGRAVHDPARSAVRHSAGAPSAEGHSPDAPASGANATTIAGWPRERPGLERSDVRPHLRHYDLLHHCRRRWRGTLPNCRLQTLERFICGRFRRGDIPGHMIPQAYHDYVRTGDTRRMQSILHHNALDLVTLVQLSLRVVLEG